MAALLIDEAMRGAVDLLTGDPAEVTTKEVALACGVSDSMVNRWRSGAYKETPSWTQMMQFPTRFYPSLHRVLNRRFGFGRLTLRRLLEDIGDLAVVVNQ